MTERVVELHATGRTASQTLPYDAVSVQAWHRRARVVYAAPPSLVAAYLPLASTTFARLCGTSSPTDAGGDGAAVVAIGDLGLGLALDEERRPVVSVEAVALLQLVRTTPGTADDGVSEWLAALQGSWVSGQCLVVVCADTGWRGCFAEHRLWSAVVLREAHGGTLKTPYARPTVRAWMAPVLLDDLAACVGRELVAQDAATVADRATTGRPTMLAATLHLFVEASHRQPRDNQVAMMRRPHAPAWRPWRRVGTQAPGQRDGAAVQRPRRRRLAVMCSRTPSVGNRWCVRVASQFLSGG